MNINIKNNLSKEKNNSKAKSRSPKTKSTQIQKDKMKNLKVEEIKEPCRKLNQLKDSLINLKKKKLANKSKSPKKDKKTNSPPKGKASTTSINGTTFEKLPRNVNEYQHILCKQNVVAADVSWVLDLREKYKSSEKINENAVPPSFYYQDLESYHEKCRKNKQDNSDYAKLSKRPLSHIEDHLVRNRFGESPNLTVTSFETTLRDFKFKTSRFEQTRYTAKNKWVANPNKTQSTFYFSNKFETESKESKDIFKRFNKFMLKPYQEKLSKTNYSDKSSLIKREVVESTNSTGYFLGEHYGLQPIDIKYGGDNLNKLRHLIDKRKDVTQATIVWEIGLRNGLEKQKSKWKGTFLKLPKVFNYDKDILKLNKKKEEQNNENNFDNKKQKSNSP